MKARAGTPINGFGSQTDGGSGKGKATETERPDFSILRKPIPTSITGFREAIKSYEEGTDEIRQLLAHECDLIYECKACRNIFRSLANFISHKRIYCRAAFSSAQHFHFRHDASGVDRDVTTIVQAEEDFAGAKTTAAASGKASFKDLSSVVERLLRREHASRPVPQVAAAALGPVGAAAELGNTEVIPASSEVVVLQLEKVKSSNCAVYQTVRREVEGAPDEEPQMSKDSIKTEVNEIHKMQEDRVTTVDVEGREVPQLIADKLTCDICQMQFETEKTLRFHIKKRHVSSTFVYPCPSCSHTFIKPMAVVRHLSNDHKKSLRRIRKMRETILRRRTRISEIQVKGPSRELARLKIEQRERAESHQRTTWPDNYSGIGGAPVVKASAKNATKTHKPASKHASLCSFCGKTFERRAALSTHLKSCPAKTTNSSSRVSNSTRSSEVDPKTAALLENDESNSNSTDSFMAMLNREKAIQAKILEQELKIIQENALAEAAAKAEREKSAMLTIHEPSTEPTKNKRKRSHVRKADVSLGCRMDDAQEEVVFQWDDDFESSDLFKGNETDMNAELEFDPLNDDSNQMNKKKAKLNLDDEDGVTECTICERKFANLSNLRRHVAMFHYRDKKFGCTLCQFKAYRKVDVFYHLSTVHKVIGDKEETTMFVRVIIVDKNKFSAEREKAVADAQLKMQQKLPVHVDFDGMIEELVVKDEYMHDGAGLKDETIELVNGISNEEIIIPLRLKTGLDQTLSYHDKKPMETYLVKEDLNQDDPLESVQNVPPKENGIFSEPPLSSAAQKPIAVPPIGAKRRGRPKGSTMAARKSLPTISTPAPYAPSLVPPAKPNKQTKLVRHSSSNSSSSEETGLSARRPVRNRIKAVNKDFVYDMSNLLKTEENFAPFISRSQKRKPIGPPTTATTPESFAVVIPEEEYVLAPVIVNPPAITNVQGAALVMAQLAVRSNQACFNRAPENPIERPIVPATIINLRRSIGSEWHVLPDTPTMKPLNRRASNEQLFDILARKKQAFDQMHQPTLTDSPGPRTEVIKQTLTTSAAKPANTHNGLSDDHQISLKFNAYTKPVASNDQPNSISTYNGTNSHPLHFDPYPNRFDVLPTPSPTSIYEHVSPKRISVIDRLADIQTKRESSNQLLHINSGDENQ